MSVITQVVSRKGKSLYSWNGFLHIPRSLHQLKVLLLLIAATLNAENGFSSFTFCLQEEGLREGFGLSTICSSSHKVI